MRCCTLLIALLAALPAFAQPQAIIPLGGNAWGDTVWFRLSHAGELNIAIKATPEDRDADISVTLGGITRTLHIPAHNDHSANTARWLIRDTGYQSVIVGMPLQSPSTKQPIQSLVLSGPATRAPMSYVPNDEGNFFYWGRRGPSVHLNYSVADTARVQWFYNELTVPAGQDREGSYFMANGFSVGYFGMQVNGPAERRILFSVWSPFQTNDPKAIPDSLRIALVRKGDGVHAGTFGDEGAGGQSYLVYPWIAGNTYRFVLGAEPQADNHTRFTAWFFPPEQGRWLLIASWDRPATYTWLTHLHSFLENFDPEQGDKDRSAYYGNQWIGDSAGHWTPLTRARFTGDNTARKGYRHDYQGGLHGNTFFLHNGGFFNTCTPLDSWFERPAPSQTSPPFNLNVLP